MEAQPDSNTRTVIEKIITATARTAVTRTKLFEYTSSIFNFSDDNHTIQKKGLTKIMNDFSSLAGRAIMLDGYHSSSKENYREEISRFPEARELQFFTVYGLIDLWRKQKYIETYADSNLLQIINKYYPNLKEWSDLYERLEMIRKVLNPSAEERKAKELLEIKGRVNPEIKKAIDKIAEEFRQVIELNEYNHLKSMVAKFQEMYPSGINLDTARRENKPAFNELRRFLVPVEKFSPVYVLAPEYNKSIIKYTYDLSVEIITSWQRKMYDKLGGFISELNKSFEVSVQGSGPRSSDIVFKFTDGSRFMITNQIVSKISNLGNFFYQYPTTFHNAYLPNGTKIQNPNEYTVKKSFNEYSELLKSKDSVKVLAEKQAARIKALKG